ncbi:MAG: transporter [Rickettsiaceae bacterium]|jgi:PAT family beta-lactamase induction signal transducer AmpG|nr:transporter [Rickettsiaceae bacterium]
MKALSLYSHPKVIAVFFLGIASGLPLALVLSTLSVWLSEVGVSRTAIGLFAAASTPYALKFLWSPLIDQLPLPFVTRLLGRRRGWMVFTQACLAIFIVMLGLSNPAENAFMTAVFAFMVSVASASQDIVIDAYRVEILEENQQGAGAAMSVFGYRVGMLLSGAGALFLAQYAGWFVTYVVMAALISIGVITIMVTGEPKTGIDIESDIHDLAIEKTSPFIKIEKWFIRAVINPFSDFMRRPGWLIVLFFIVLYKLGDAFAGVMTNPFLIETGFSKAEIATVVKSFGFVALLLGTFLGGAVVNKMGMMKALWVCGILQMVSTLAFAVQAHFGYNVELLAVTIATENLTGGMGTAAFVAYISSLCNVRYTATQYALFSSLASVGRTWLSASSGWFVDQVGWINFFVLSTAIAIPGLLMLILLRKVKE